MRLLIDADNRELRQQCSVSANGYVVFTSSPREYLHRVVMERSIGWALADGAIVHHLNGNRLDNRRRNLSVIESQSKHVLAHALERIRARGGDPKSERICSTCTRLLGKAEFPRFRGSWDGRGTSCSDCANGRRRGMGYSRWTPTKAAQQRLRRAAKRRAA